MKSNRFRVVFVALVTVFMVAIAVRVDAAQPKAGSQATHAKGQTAVVKSVPILRFVQTVPVAAVERFVAAERIMIATWGFPLIFGATCYTDTYFRNHFMDKEEKGVPAGELNIHVLVSAEHSFDESIMKELGANLPENAYLNEATTKELVNKKVVIPLAHFFQLIEAQSKGQEGVLFVNGQANIAFIMGSDGKIWAVYAYFTKEGYWRFVDGIVLGLGGQRAAGVQIISGK